VSHDPTRWHFSENTDLSETLFVARKASDGGGTLCLNLWRNPDNPVDALLLAEEARKLAPAGDTLQTFDLWLGDTKWGEALYLPDAHFKSLPNWMLPCAYAQREMTDALLTLQAEHNTTASRFPLRPCRSWVRWDPIEGACIARSRCFSRTARRRSTPPSGDTIAESVATLQQSPNCYLSPKVASRATPVEPGRRHPDSGANVVEHAAGWSPFP
jgi:hypothetical protein